LPAARDKRTIAAQNKRNADMDNSVQALANTAKQLSARSNGSGKRS